MLAKYLNPMQLFYHLTNEGHPSFFYLINMPFAKAGLSIFAMQAICWLSCVISVFLIWRYLKFPTLLKVAITVSAPFFYFFPIIARSYSLVPLLVLLLAILYGKSKTHPFIYAFILVCLLNTHIIMAFFCFLLACDFAYQNVILPYKNEKKIEKKYIMAGLIMLIGGIILFCQLIGTTSSNVYIKIEHKDILGAFLGILMFFSFNSLDAYYIKTHSDYFTPLTLSILAVYFITFILLFISLFKISKKHFSICFFSIAFQILIYLLAYSNLIFPTRIFCAYMILIFSYFQVYEFNLFKNDSFLTSKKLSTVLLSIAFGLTIFNGIKAYLADIFIPYSGSKPLADFIKKNIPSNRAKIFTNTTNYAVAINYYLEPNGIYWIRSGKPFKYTVWTKDMREPLDYEIWDAYFQKLREADKKTDFYTLIVYNPFLPIVNANLWKNFDVVYISGDSIEYFEKFILFKYKK